MSHVYLKMLIAWMMFIIAFPMMRVSGWFGVMIPIGLVLGILYWFDTAQAFRDSEIHALRLLGMIMGIPQALLGLSIGVGGLTIMGWVLYNSFVERQESYTGGFLTFGLSPVLVAVGFGWAGSSLRKTRTPPPGKQDRDDKSASW